MTTRDHDPPEADILLTVKEVAAQCPVSVRTVQRWIVAGELPALRLGRSVRLRRVDLVAFFKRARQSQKHEGR